MHLNKSFFVGLAVALFASGAGAQGIKDHRRTVPVDLMPATPVGAMESNKSSAFDYVDEATRNVAPDTAIAVTPATHISLDTLGVYSAANGGVSIDAWQGVTHAQARAALEALPENISSSVIRDLLVKLLLSTTRPPQSENIQQNLFEPRIQALLRLGETAQAKKLLEMVPQDLRHPGIARLNYTAHLLDGDISWVCESISKTLAEDTANAPHWQKISAYCLARAKKEAEAQIAIDLLAEENEAQLDPGFVELVDVMLGRRAKLENPMQTPLSLDDAALIALSGVNAFPKDYLKTAPAAIVKLAKGNAEEKTRKKPAIQSWFLTQFKKMPDRSFDFDKAVKEMEVKSEQTGTLHAYRLHTLLQALGFTAIESEGGVKELAVKNVSRTQISPLLRAQLQMAANNRKSGLAILLLAAIAGQDTLANMNDGTLADMIRALKLAGFDDESKDFAAEAMAALY